MLSDKRNLRKKCRTQLEIVYPAWDLAKITIAGIYCAVEDLCF